MAKKDDAKPKTVDEQGKAVVAPKRDPRHDPAPYPDQIPLHEGGTRGFEAGSHPESPAGPSDEGRGYTYPPSQPVGPGETPPDDGKGSPNWTHDPANRPNYERPAPAAADSGTPGFTPQAGVPTKGVPVDEQSVGPAKPKGK